MSLFFTDEQIENFSSGDVRCDLLIKMDFKSGPAYLWNGNTKLTSGDQVWSPMMGAAKIDGLSIPVGTTAKSVTFELKGLNDQITDLLAKALESVTDVQQQLVTIYLQLFDKDWQVFGLPIGIWWGFMQPPRISRTAADQTNGAIQSISLSAENAFFNRSRPPYGRYTDRDQQRRSPGDRFFQYIPSLLFKTFIYPDY